MSCLCDADVGLLAAISLGLMFGLVIGSISLGALYVHRRRYHTQLHSPFEKAAQLYAKNESENLTNQQHATLAQSAQWRHMFSEGENFCINLHFLRSSSLILLDIFCLFNRRLYLFTMIMIVFFVCLSVSVIVTRHTLVYRRVCIAVFSLPGYRYLVDSGTDRREILRNDTDLLSLAAVPLRSANPKFSV